MSTHVLRADARRLPLADNSVDLVVTSPPYFGLRSYQDGGEHYVGQVGDEATPAEFVDALLDVTRECMRVLKPSGSMWVNLGDKYSTGNSGQSGMAKLGEQYSGGGHSDAKAKQRSAAVAGMRPKSLIGIPWRYALRCIDDLGLILRAEVIWSKPNGLPESVTDRVRRSHEQWFHFTLEPRYFSAVDEVREAHVDPRPPTRPMPSGGRELGRWADDAPGRIGAANSLGKLPGSVWTIPTQPLQVPASLGIDHFAAFPMEWPRRIIRGWSPSGICVECGEGRLPVVTTEREHGWTRQTIGSGGNRNPGEAVGQQVTNRALHTITGEACGCPDTSAPTRPAVVLDPFGGTGTTALVADALGRDGISVDLSADYCRLATWRTTDPGQRAAAMQVDKPPPQSEGQGGLW